LQDDKRQEYDIGPGMSHNGFIVPFGYYREINIRDLTNCESN
jgi:hypothetical protein